MRSKSGAGVRLALAEALLATSLGHLGELVSRAPRFLRVTRLVLLPNPKHAKII